VAIFGPPCKITVQCSILAERSFSASVSFLIILVETGV